MNDMKKKYTDQDIDQFFEGIKEIPPLLTLSETEQLITDVKASPSDVISPRFNPLNFYTMTTTTIIITALSVFFFAPEKDGREITAQETIVQPALPWANEESFDKPSPAENKVTTYRAENNDQESQNPLQAKKTLHEQTVYVAGTESVSTSEVGSVQSGESKYNKPAMVVVPEVSCDWPSDTTLQGKDLLIRLTAAEWEKMGFLITYTGEDWEKMGFKTIETGFYYNNIYEGIHSSFHQRSEIRDVEPGVGYSDYGETTGLLKTLHGKNQKTTASHHDFYPLFLSDKLYNMTSALDGNEASFQSSMGSLVPIVRGGRIFWFLPTESLFENLPERYNSLKNSFDCVLSLGKNTGRTDIITYQKRSLIAINPNQYLDLSQKTLKNVGFSFKDDKISFTQDIGSCTFEFFISKQSFGWNDYMIKSDNKTINLKFQTDIHGQRNINWYCDVESSVKSSTEYFSKQTEILIPILLTTKRFPEYLDMDMILWFEPSEALFRALEEEIGTGMEEEYNNLISGDPTDTSDPGSCTYFEYCRSTLHLDELVVYPNPAKSETTLRFTLHEEITGSILLLNITGQEIKAFNDNITFGKGVNTHALDLSGVPRGIYLLGIYSDKGYTTRRLIIH